MGSRNSKFNQGMVGAGLGIWLLITACSSLSTTAPSVPPTCIAPKPNVNPYISDQIAPGVEEIFQNSFSNLGKARQDALFQLGRNMEHWSSQVDVVNDTVHMVRVTVTYLDPV